MKVLQVIMKGKTRFLNQKDKHETIEFKYKDIKCIEEKQFCEKCDRLAILLKAYSPEKGRMSINKLCQECLKTLA